MPSPFPGMDPYLEGALWPTIHYHLSDEIARQLNPKLQPRYVALGAERFVMDLSQGVQVTTEAIIPDVGVKKSDTGGIALQQPPVAAAPLQLLTEMPVMVPQVTIEIRDTANRLLVTAIEVLSPTNKRGEGYHEYLGKRRRLLVSSSHLLEIDLLRQGRRLPMQKQLPEAPYFVFLSRVEKRPVTDVWPLSFQDPLPTVPVPLLPGDADVPLDLQLAFTTMYDLFGYRLLVDYQQPPEMPLPPEMVPWAEERVRAFLSPP